MSQYGKKTDEYGNVVNRPGGGTGTDQQQYGAQGGGQTHGTTGSTGACKTDQYGSTGTTGAHGTHGTGVPGGGGLLQRSGSSSSSEDDGQGGRRKKGLKDKVKEKLPGGKTREEQAYGTTTGTGGMGYGEEQQDKKGMMEKIKEKLPGNKYLAKKPKPKMKPIELKTPPEQTQTITRVIFDVLKEHGPLTIADTWEHVKDVGLRGLSSKRHMKIVMRWMRERQKLRLICNHVGPHKQFLYTTWFTKPDVKPTRPGLPEIKPGTGNASRPKP